MLANHHLQPIADLLENMPLKAAQSRARSKLLTLVKEAIARFGEDEYDLVTHYATLDDRSARNSTQHAQRSTKPRPQPLVLPSWRKMPTTLR